MNLKGTVRVSQKEKKEVIQFKNKVGTFILYKYSNKFSTKSNT